MLFRSGPFGGFEVDTPADAQEIANLKKIGDFFKLKSLILASPDIPIWAITTGRSRSAPPRRSNFLRACLRRFDEAYLFTNDAEKVGYGGIKLESKTRAPSNCLD